VINGYLMIEENRKEECGWWKSDGSGRENM